MNRFWLLSIVGLLACDVAHEPSAQSWTLDEEPSSASLEENADLKTFPFQASMEQLHVTSRGQTGYVFEIEDVFDQPDKPQELRYLSARRQTNDGTVWLRLPKQVFGFEAAFECPATSIALYSRVQVEPGIEVSCIVGRTWAFLVVVFSGVEERWDRENPRLAIGLAPDKMLYEWRMKGWENPEFSEIFHFAYLMGVTWTHDRTYGGYRL